MPLLCLAYSGLEAEEVSDREGHCCCQAFVVLAGGAQVGERSCQKGCVEPRDNLDFNFEFGIPTNRDDHPKVLDNLGSETSTTSRCDFDLDDLLLHGDSFQQTPHKTLGGKIDLLPICYIQHVAEISKDMNEVYLEQVDLGISV